MNISYDWETYNELIEELAENLNDMASTAEKIFQKNRDSTDMLKEIKKTFSYRKNPSTTPQQLIKKRRELWEMQEFQMLDQTFQEAQVVSLTRKEQSSAILLSGMNIIQATNVENYSEPEFLFEHQRNQSKMTSNLSKRSNLSTFSSQLGKKKYEKIAFFPSNRNF